MINHLANYFKRLHFSKPDPTDIIIFDETNSNLIERVIPEDLTASIFKMRPIEFYVTPSIVFNFIRNLNHFKFLDGPKSNRNFLHKTLWQLLLIYIKADLISRNPKAIITFIDNCSKFAWLSENFNEAPCIAVQNGFRLSYDANVGSQYYCQHLFCFGQREIIDFPKLGYKVDNFYPVGSLNLSINLKNTLPKGSSKYDLLIVSCWRGNIGFGEDVADSMKGMRIMDQFLSFYLQKRDINAAVIMRSERDSDDWIMPEIGMSEEDYYRSIYGDALDIIDTNFSERNIYSVMQDAELIIAGFSTTCLLEAFSFGKKILYANFCETQKYHIDFKQEIVFNGSIDDNAEFNRKLDAMLSHANDDYMLEHENLIKYYMQIPNDGSTCELIKQKIKEIVN